MTNIQNVTVGFIGCGSMGGALVRSFAKSIPSNHIFVSASHFEHAHKIAQKTGCNACKTNTEVACCDIVFLAVKPAIIRQVITEIHDSLKSSTTVVSMAAGITLDILTSLLPNNQVIRIMPNMPAAISQAMTALCCKDSVSKDTVKNISELLTSAGLVEQVPEKLMDCVTAVSGSGPAFVFMFIEAMADAAVRFGMPRKQAYVYAAQTVLGSAAMVLSDERCPGTLKDAVCSPAGTTIEGVAALERTGLRNAVIEAVTAAYNKSVNMSK
ncbi:MAG: pyrroline-5-carboxylate reductase [Treponema sp.]|nr:pyrroline-5-carboxylate reductase [Treponema sp.]